MRPAPLRRLEGEGSPRYNINVESGAPRVGAFWYRNVDCRGLRGPSHIPAKTPGDLYVVLQIALPPADDDKSREMYKRMKDEIRFNPRAAMEVAWS